MLHFTVESKLLLPKSHEPRLPKILVSRKDDSVLRERSEILRVAVNAKGALGLLFGYMKIRSDEGFPIGSRFNAVRQHIFTIQINRYRTWPFFSFGKTRRETGRVNLLFGGGKRLRDPVSLSLECEAGGEALSQQFAVLIPVSGAEQKIRRRKHSVEQIWNSVDALTPDSNDEEIEALWCELMAADRCITKVDKLLWLKSAIVIDAVRSRNYRLNRKRLRKLEQLLNGSPTTGDFNEILQDVNIKISPTIIGPHGYRVAPSQIDQQELFSELAEMMNFLEERGFPAFLNSGSLLGLHRDGRLIPHDDDLDIGVYFGDCNINDLIVLNTRLLTEISERYSFFEKGLGKFGAIKLKSGVEVDIFPAWSKEDRFYVYPYMFGELKKSDVVPFVKKVFFGSTLNVPVNIEGVLDVNYGESWRNPDPMWKFDWRRAKKRFHEFHEAQIKFNEMKESSTK